MTSNFRGLKKTRCLNHLAPASWQPSRDGEHTWKWFSSCRNSMILSFQTPGFSLGCCRSLYHPKKVAKNCQVHTFAISFYQLCVSPDFFHQQLAEKFKWKPNERFPEAKEWTHLPHDYWPKPMGASPDLYSKDHSGSRFCSCWETCTRLDVCVLVEYSGFGIGCRVVWGTLTFFVW